MSKQIPLTQGKFAVVDDEDYDWLMKYKWCARKRVDGITWYACRKIYVDGRWYQQQMHRLILNPPEYLVCDHINGDGLDNRRTNLRLATTKQNVRNRRLSSNNTTGFKGVSVPTSGNKYQAQIRVDGRLIFLGLFSNKIDAALAYNEAALKYHGKFARLNVLP